MVHSRVGHDRHRVELFARKHSIEVGVKARAVAKCALDRGGHLGRGRLMPVAQSRDAKAVEVLCQLDQPVGVPHAHAAATHQAQIHRHKYLPP